MAFIRYFRKAFYSVSSWSAFLRHLVHQRSLTGLAQSGEGGAVLLRDCSHSPFKGKQRCFNLRCHHVLLHSSCHSAAQVSLPITKWQAKELSKYCQLFQKCLEWHTCYSRNWHTLRWKTNVAKPFIIQWFTADAKIPSLFSQMPYLHSRWSTFMFLA